MKKHNYNFDIEGLKLPIECMRIVAQTICDDTQNLVKGNVEKYDGEVYSKYDSSGSIAETFENLNRGKIVYDVQNELGAIKGDQETKLEFFLTSEELKDYKCRLFFVEHGLGGYPARVILESGIADDVFGKSNEGYIITCNTMVDFKELLNRVMDSEYVHELIQSIITESLLRRNRDDEIKKNSKNKK